MLSARLLLATVVATAAASMLSPSLADAAGDLKAGRQKALRCQACHGMDGVSKLPEAPNLSGQVEQYIIKALNDFRSGARQNELMSLMASGLQDQDIADLAAYYSAFQITVQKPQ